MCSKTGSNKKCRWSLAAWLTVCYSAFSITIVAGVTVYSYSVLISNLNYENDVFVGTYMKEVESRLRDDPDEIVELQNSWDLVAAGPYPVRILMRVLTTDGSILAATPGHEQVPWPAAAARGTSQPSSSDFWRCSSHAAKLKSGQPVVLQATLDRRPEALVFSRYRKQLYLVLAVAAFACTVGGVVLARRGLRPLRELSSMSAGVKAHHMAERLDASKYASELEQVATTFNGMLDRLQESFERINRFSGDIAHELRTPLNNLRGEVEVALTKTRTIDEYQEVLGSCLEEAIRLSRLVDSLLFLARSERPESALSCDSLRLAEELETIADFYDAAADDGRITLQVHCPSHLELFADRTLFQRAIGNLITNSLAHTPPNGRVEIRGELIPEGIRVIVQDTGSGIPRDQIPRVFDRLFRGNNGPPLPTGHGLGLSIVRTIVELHGGSVEIDSQLSQGTTVDTRWPMTSLTPVTSDGNAAKN